MNQKEDYFLKLPEVMRRTCLGRSTIFSRVKANTFPAQIKLSPRTSVWSFNEISNWIEDQKNEAPEEEDNQ